MNYAYSKGVFERDTVVVGGKELCSLGEAPESE